MLSLHSLCYFLALTDSWISRTLASANFFLFVLSLEALLFQRNMKGSHNKYGTVQVMHGILAVEDRIHLYKLEQGAKCERTDFVQKIVVNSIFSVHNDKHEIHIRFVRICEEIMNVYAVAIGSGTLNTDKSNRWLILSLIYGLVSVRPRTILCSQG